MRGSRVWRLKGLMAQALQIVRLKHSIIHASCLVPCRTWHWPQAQVLSHLPSQSYNHPLLHTQDCCPTIHMYTATIHGGVAVLWISNLPKVMSRKGSISTGNSRLNIKIKYLTELWEMTIKIQLLKIWMNLDKLVSRRCTSTSHSAFEEQKALLTRTSKTNNYVRCWLHHCFLRSEKQALILLENKEFQGNMMQCFHATVNRVPRRSYQETEATNRETSSRVVFILFLDMRTRQMWGDLFLKVTRIICLMKQGLIWWNRNLKWNLSTAVSMSLATSLCSKIGITGRKTPISWISTTTSSSTRIIIDERKSASRYSDTEYSRDGRNEESSRITSRRILCTEVERKSWDNTKAHFPIAGFWRISRSGIELQCEIVLRSQSISSDSKFSFHAELRQTLAIWHMECTWITGERFY